MNSILVIDTPEDCLACPCFSVIGSEHCSVTMKEVGLHIPMWCPLKPLPQKMKTPITEAIPVEWMEVWLAEHEAWDFRTTFIDMINDWRNGETE